MLVNYLTENFFPLNSFGYYAVHAVGILLCIALPYLLGSLNFAIIISKLFFRDDIRNILAVTAATEADQIRDPVNQHRSLTTAGAGQKQQRPFCGQNGLLLHLIQIGKLGANIIAPRGKIPLLEGICHMCTCSLS